MIYLYQYNDNNIRLVFNKSFVGINKANIKEKTEDEKNSNSLNSAISRSRKVIREYSMCNDFKYFFTSTVNSSVCNRYSLDVTQDKIRYIIKEFIKRKNKDFKYVFITEKHKDGAFHFHGLCSDLELYTNKNGYLSSSAFDKLGFNSFSEIKSREKVSNYILKYITKDCVRNSRGSLYFCSRRFKKSR